MAPRLSATGKRLGRPPKIKTESVSAVNVPTPNSLAQAIRAQYDAGGRGRRVAAWNPPASGPNRAIQNHELIRSRSHDTVRNDWSGESTVQKWATALIGIAITPRFIKIKSEKRRAEITELFVRFVSQADADCVLDLFGMQTLGVRTWIEGGECFIRRRSRFLDEGLAVPMQIQMLEGEMCPVTFDSDQFQGLPQGNIIRSGIELNKRGKRVAFWFYKDHPGDAARGSILTDPNGLVRVAASDVAHMFEQKRPGQLRGVPTLAPTIVRTRNIGDFEDTTLERQKMANMLVGFITRALPTFDANDPMQAGLGLGISPATMEAALAAAGIGGAVGQPDDLIPLAPGLVQELEDGQSMEWSKPPDAGTNYSEYLRTNHLGNAAAAGLPYELYSGDIANVSDRTLRVLINDFRRLAQQRQWQIVIPQMCQKVIEWFADAAYLADLITLDEIPDVKGVEHAPHGWEYIHPVQDVQGKILEMVNGLRSRSDIIGQRGDDPGVVDAERKRDKEREDELGLTPEVVDPNAAPPDDDTETPAEKEERQKQASADLHIKMAKAREMEANACALRAQALALRREAPAPPVDPLAAQRLAIQERTLAFLTDDEPDED